MTDLPDVLYAYQSIYSKCAGINDTFGNNPKATAAGPVMFHSGASFAGLSGVSVGLVGVMMGVVGELIALAL